MIAASPENAWSILTMNKIVLKEEVAADRALADRALASRRGGVAHFCLPFGFDFRALFARAGLGFQAGAASIIRIG